MARQREAPATTISIRMPLSLIEEIDNAADRFGLTRAEVIRRGARTEMQKLESR